MADKGVILERRTAQRIVAATKRVENTPADSTGEDGKPNTTSPRYLCFFPVLVVEPETGGGADGNATTVASWAYDLYRLADTEHANKLNDSPLQPENSPARIIEGKVNRAADDSVGMAYRDTTGAIKLYTCAETRVKKVCT